MGSTAGQHPARVAQSTREWTPHLLGLQCRQALSQCPLPILQLLPTGGRVPGKHSVQSTQRRVRGVPRHPAPLGLGQEELAQLRFGGLQVVCLGMEQHRRHSTEATASHACGAPTARLPSGRSVRTFSAAKASSATSRRSCR